MTAAGIIADATAVKGRPARSTEFPGQVVRVQQSEVAAADDGAEPVGSTELGVEVLQVLAHGGRPGGHAPGDRLPGQPVGSPSTAYSRRIKVIAFLSGLVCPASVNAVERVTRPAVVVADAIDDTDDQKKIGPD